VQETIDAATELRKAGYLLGRVIVNRARPVLVSNARPDGQLLADGLQLAGLDPAIAPALITEVTDYAARQDVQTRAEAELADLEAPVVRLPELSPIDLGGLYELAEQLDVQDWHQA